MMNLATRKRVLREIDRVDQMGEAEYLRITGFKKPRGVYLVNKNMLYPARAIWAMARPVPLSQYDNASMYSKADAFHRLDPSFDLTSQASYQGFVESRSAIEDHEDQTENNSSPKYREIVSKSFIRNAKVRISVIRRSKGKCELSCSYPLFVANSGHNYLEAHHILALSCQGEDSRRNVIALCPSHHRECHYGVDWEDLNQQCLKAIARAEK